MHMKNSKRPTLKPNLNSSFSRKAKRTLSKIPFKTHAKNSPKSAKPACHHRRTVSDSAGLVPLQGKLLEKAPKVFKNQIFRDIYDEFGNHDRVLDTLESIEIYEEVNKGNFLTFNNRSDVSTEKFILPDTSYKSVEDTNKCFKEELFGKLQEWASGENKEKKLTSLFTMEKHRYTRNSAFVFPVVFGIN